MFKKISNSWSIFKLSFGIIRSDSKLLILPFVSFVILLVLMAVFFIPAIIFTSSETDSGNVVSAVILFFYYLASYFVIIYFNSALTFIVFSKLSGQNMSIDQGFSKANSRLSAIFTYALIAATIGMILQYLKEKAGFLGKIFSFLGTTAWNLTTFLVIPVLVTQNVGAIDAIKQSGSLFKKTWGEQIFGALGSGLALFLMSLPFLFLSILIIVLGAGAASPALVVFGVVTLVLVIVILALIASATDVVYRAILYKYATEGAVPAGVNPSLITLK